MSKRRPAPPADDTTQKKRIRQVERIINVIQETCAYDLTPDGGDWRDFGDIEPDVAYRLLHELRDVYKLANRTNVSPALKCTKENIYTTTGVHLAQLIGWLISAVECGIAYKNGKPISPELPHTVNNRGQIQSEAFETILNALGILRNNLRFTEAVATDMAKKKTVLVDLIPCVEVAKVVGRDAGRSDKLAEKMRRREYPVVVLANKNHCQRKDAIAMFPRKKQRILEI